MYLIYICNILLLTFTLKHSALWDVRLSCVSTRILSLSLSLSLIRGSKRASIIYPNPSDWHLFIHVKIVQAGPSLRRLIVLLASHLFDKEKDKPVKRETRENRQRESKGGKRNAGNAYTCSPRASTHMRERDSTHMCTRARTSLSLPLPSLPPPHTSALKRTRLEQARVRPRTRTHVDARSVRRG